MRADAPRAERRRARLLYAIDEGVTMSLMLRRRYADACAIRAAEDARTCPADTRCRAIRARHALVTRDADLRCHALPLDS